MKEAQASELADQSKYERAMELLKPAAVASLAGKQDSISSSVANLIEWANIDNPPIIIVEPNAIWKYQDDGINQEDDWRQSGFNDENWKEGPGKFGYGGDGETTKLEWGGDRNNKVTTYYFRHSFNIDESSKRPFVVADLIKDDGVVIYLNGNEIIRNNMPGGEIDFSSFSAKTAWEHNNNGPENNELYVHRHVIPEENIRIGRNVLAAELHQCNKGSSDLGFQFELYGSNQTPSAYINEIISGTDGADLMRVVADLIPKQIREKTLISINLALGKISSEEIKNADLETLLEGFKIAAKLNTENTLGWVIDGAVQALEEDSTPENLTKRVEVLNIKMKILKETGGDEQAISDLDDLIVSPPRAENLPSELIDLSAYYNSSLFHYSAFHGGGEDEDLRFLASSYEQAKKTPFDLRGVIRLNSGPFANGKTANEGSALSSLGRKYPNEVTGIAIDSKAEKIHFLMGSTFSTNMEKGATAATFRIKYDDGKTLDFPIIAKEDIFDWWTPYRSPGLMEKELQPENIGWIGVNYKGEGRGLVKPIWVNPHPDKTIATIDFISGLIRCAPFVVGITLE